MKLFAELGEQNFSPLPLRVAQRCLKPSQIGPPVQSSRRDSILSLVPVPWTEIHGYFQCLAPRGENACFTPVAEDNRCGYQMREGYGATFRARRGSGRDARSRAGLTPAPATNEPLSLVPAPARAERYALPLQAHLLRLLFCPARFSAIDCMKTAATEFEFEHARFPGVLSVFQRFSSCGCPRLVRVVSRIMNVFRLVLCLTGLAVYLLAKQFLPSTAASKSAPAAAVSPQS